MKASFRKGLVFNPLSANVRYVQHEANVTYSGCDASYR